jgi:hypothetical protein
MQGRGADNEAPFLDAHEDRGGVDTVKKEGTYKRTTE